MMKKKTALLGWAIVLVLALSLGRVWIPAQFTATPVPPQTAAAPPALDALRAFPAEEQQAIHDALDRIARGGPFLHAKDGSEFSNRERRLPPQIAGYYREYTVETPGASDRGARRIVTGNGGDVYYTDDHYRSFVRLQ
jgi:ribonuclease T1